MLPGRTQTSLKKSKAPKSKKIGGKKPPPKRVMAMAPVLEDGENEDEDEKSAAAAEKATDKISSSGPPKSTFESIPIRKAVPVVRRGSSRTTTPVRRGSMRANSKNNSQETKAP